MSRVLVIPDLQIPFEHPDSLEFLMWAQDRYQCDTVINIGDEVDFHAISFHTHNPSGYSPGHELQVAKDKLKPYFKAFPDCTIMTSNHTSRPYRRAFEYGIPEELMKSYNDIFNAPKGWKWVDSVIIDDVKYFHGEGLSGANCARNACIQHMRSMVFGHVHAHAGIYYYATAEKLMFGFNVGCLIWDKAYAFAYAKHMPQKPILGCGVVLDGVPQFIPMILNKHGRWHLSSQATKQKKIGKTILVKCPKCGGQASKRGLTANGAQRYVCKECRTWWQV